MVSPQVTLGVVKRNAIPYLVGKAVGRDHQPKSQDFIVD